MALSRAVKVILCVFAMPVMVWTLASLYFTLAGCDISGDFTSDYLPAPQNLKPEENAYVAIKEYAENLPSNTTPLHVNYRLRRAYLDGTTNRLALADEARAYIAAESNTIAVAKRILSSKGIEVPFEEITLANMHIWKLMRIAHVYNIKATCEAVQGDLEEGRRSLMEAYRIGHFLLTHDSPLFDISRVLAYTIFTHALRSAEKPLFAPDDDEAWRVKLRELNILLHEGDPDGAKKAAMRHLNGIVRTVIVDHATNRSAVARGMYGVCNLWEGAIAGKKPIDDVHRIKDLERRFLEMLTTVCPGYARYSFQPNRTYAAQCAKLEEFCRKVDEPVYDVEYATEYERISVDRFSRNWIFRRTFASDWCSSYKLLFSMRFTSRVRTARLACRSYKAKYGRYPETLSALVPEFLVEVPRDPYDGEELRYNAKDGFIWTRGEALAFDGNVTITKKGKPYFRTYSDERCVIFLDKP
jgi:hypothetical protein